MDILDEELLRLWRVLSETQVRYIMVGGFATNLHGYARTTADADIWIEDTLENRSGLRLALKRLEIGDFEQLEYAELVPGWSSIYLNSGLELDIMTSIMGFGPEKFFGCYQAAPTAFIHDIPVKFLHLNHLLKAKTSCGRPKDLLDVEELKKINPES